MGLLSASLLQAADVNVLIVGTTYVRTLAEVVRWQLVVEALGEPITVSWNGLEPPQGMALYLQEVADGRPVGAAVDMTQAGSVACLQTTEYQIVLGLEREYVMTLQPGWNLVSQPLLTTAPPVFATAYGFTGRNWKKLHGEQAGTAGTGLMVYAREASQLTASGVPATNGMRLNRGWSLVGAVEASFLPKDAGKAYRIDANGNYHPVSPDEPLAPGEALLIH